MSTGEANSEADVALTKQDESRFALFADGKELESDVEIEERDNRLVIHNGSQLQQSFIVFPGLPTFEVPQTPSPVFTCVYQTSAKVAEITGSRTFVLKDSSPEQASDGRRYLYVVAGVNDWSLQPEMELQPYIVDQILMELSDDDNARVAKSSACILTKSEDSQPFFMKDKDIDKKTKLTAAQPGCVKIIVDESFDATDTDIPFVGIGMLNPRKREPYAIPVSVWRAWPGTTVNVRPSQSWRFKRGSSLPSTTIETHDIPPEQTTQFSKSGMKRVLRFDGAKFIVVP